jgi:Kef-type K+ transport system membrane component KefB
MLDVSLDVMILLFAAMLGIVIARRFGQSAILGEILLGIIIGPTLLGWVHYDEPVRILAELGAIFMLFTIGLECNYREVYNVKNSIVALFGVIVPFAAGYGLALLFGYKTLEALFIATALTATSIAITARILQERGLLSSPVAKTIIGAAVVDDILGLIALSIISSMTGTMTATQVGIKVAVALAFVGACVLLIRPANWVMHRIDDWAQAQGMHQITLFAAMVVAFGYAGIAAIIGMSSIVGAFLAGVTLESFHIKSMREGTVYLEWLFSAIFFVALGVAADFSSFGGAWLFALALIAVAVVTKLIGCMLPARACGHTWKESVSIGFGMVPRGEVAMIVGLLGLTAGIITKQTYAVIILMAFATTIVTPLILNWSLAEKNPKAEPAERRAAA